MKSRTASRSPAHAARAMSKLRRNARQAGAPPATAPTPPAGPGSATDACQPIRRRCLPRPMPRAAARCCSTSLAPTSGYVAVGERGHVLRFRRRRGVDTAERADALRADVGRPPPTTRSGPRGHDGVILHSADGGHTWKSQRRDPYRLAEGQTRPTTTSRQGAPRSTSCSSTTPAPASPSAPTALMLVTTDGGATWTPTQAHRAGGSAATSPAAPMEGDTVQRRGPAARRRGRPAPQRDHRAGDGSLVIVGERGTLLRSDDAGATWRRSPSRTRVRCSACCTSASARLLAFGLRGNVYESRRRRRQLDQGRDPAAATSLMGGTVLDGGGAVLAGANGTVLTRAGAATAFVAITFRNARRRDAALAGIAPHRQRRVRARRRQGRRHRTIRSKRCPRRMPR